jgi:MFS family permease
MSLFGGMSFFSPILSLYFIAKGVSLPQIIFSQSLYSILTLLSELPTGLIADKIGNKAAVIVGGLFNVASVALFLALPSAWGLYAGFAVSGIGDALLSGSSEALVYDVSAKGEYRSQWSRVLANSMFGTAIGAVVAGALYMFLDEGSFYPLLIAGLVARVLCAVLILFVKVAKNKSKRAGQEHMLTILKHSLILIRKNTVLRNLTFVKLLTLSAQYVLYAIYQPYFKDHAVPAIFIGLVIAFGALTNGFFFRLVSKFERLFSLDKAVVIFPGVMAATYLLFSIFHNPWVLVLLFVLLQAQFNLLDPMVSDYINDQVSSDMRATVLSGISFIRSTADLVSKFTLGFVAAGFGVVGLLRFQAAYLVIGGLLSWWLLKRCGCIYVLNKSE